ncbi:hypothetical protein V8C86DRAFT_680593 [Haematococcus lacustris]
MNKMLFTLCSCPSIRRPSSKQLIRALPTYCDTEPPPPHYSSSRCSCCLHQVIQPVERHNMVNGTIPVIVTYLRLWSYTALWMRPVLCTLATDTGNRIVTINITRSTKMMCTPTCSGSLSGPRHHVKPLQARLPTGHVWLHYTTEWNATQQACQQASISCQEPRRQAHTGRPRQAGRQRPLRRGCADHITSKARTAVGTHGWDRP